MTFCGRYCRKCLSAINENKECENYAPDRTDIQTASEASVQRLEVTIGCSHNKCSFCTMYRKTPFRVAPLEDVEMDLKELHDRGEKITRTYLTNGDPFVLGTDRLVKIAELVHQYLPEVEVLTCYASIQNLKAKSLEELKLLKSVGYDELYVGLETAYAPAVKLINKGFTVEEAYENIGKLKEAGMKYSALLMLGLVEKGIAKKCRSHGGPSE